MLSAGNLLLTNKWTPAHLRAGLLAGWYDAADLTTITQSGGAVSQWDDKSGGGYHLTQGTGSQQPLTGSVSIGGKNALYFNGANSQEMRTTGNPFGSTISDAFVIFVLDCRTIANSILFNLNLSGAQWTTHAPWSDGRIYFDVGGSAAPNRVNASSGWSANTDHIISYYCSTTDNVQQVYTDGALKVGDATGHSIAVTSAMVLGSGGGYLHDTVDIGEWIVVNGTVSAALRQKFEGYLAWKWGLQSTLPSNHPYRWSAP